MRRCLAAGALSLALCAGAARTPAQTNTPALNFESLGSGFDYTQGSYSNGWRFSTKQDTTVTALGFYDDLQDGLTESHPVAIYDRETRQALATTTVVPGDPLTGFFRFHPLTTPVTLRGGRDYFIFALTGTEHYAVAPSQLEISPFITFEGFAAADNSNGSQTTLTPPDDSSYGPINNFHGDFGPSFKIANGTAPTTAAVDFPSLTGS